MPPKRLHVFSPHPCHQGSILCEISESFSVGLLPLPPDVEDIFAGRAALDADTWITYKRYAAVNNYRWINISLVNIQTIFKNLFR